LLKRPHTNMMHFLYQIAVSLLLDLWHSVLSDFYNGSIVFNSLSYTATCDWQRRSWIL